MSTTARHCSGVSCSSGTAGAPIPDERLEADPAAELTVEEARQAEREAEHEQARDVGE